MIRMFVTAKTSLLLFSLGHILMLLQLRMVLMELENKSEQVGWGLALCLGRISLPKLTDLSNLISFDQWGKVSPYLFFFFTFTCMYLITLTEKPNYLTKEGPVGGLLSMDCNSVYPPMEIGWPRRDTHNYVLSLRHCMWCVEEVLHVIWLHRIITRLSHL